MKSHTKRMKKPNTPNLKPGRQVCADALAALETRRAPVLDKRIYRALDKRGRRAHLYDGAYIQAGSDGAYIRCVDALVLLKLYEADPTQLWMRVKARGRGGPSRVRVARFEATTVREFLRDPD